MAALAYPYGGIPNGPSRGRATVARRHGHLRLVGGPECIEEQPRGSRPLPSPRPRLRRFLPAIATAAALLGVWFGADALVAAGGTSQLAQLQGARKVAGGYAYVVRPGDTLWSIATRLSPSSDPRPLVDHLAGELHGAALQPGEVLVVP